MMRYSRLPATITYGIKKIATFDEDFKRVDFLEIFISYEYCGYRFRFVEGAIPILNERVN